VKKTIIRLNTHIKMQLESDFMHRVLRGCLIQPNHGLNVPSLKQLSLQSTAFWAVCTLHRLHDSPDSKVVRASSDEIMKAARDCITNKIPGKQFNIFQVFFCYYLPLVCR